MTLIPLNHVLMLAAILFALGVAGVLMRRNIVFVLMSLEVVLNATGLAFVAAGARWAEPDGQMMFVLVLTLAAAEVTVALALMLQAVRHYGSLDLDTLRRMRN
jgi:NADH-quinone oxidoreductase subunit K